MTTVARGTSRPQLPPLDWPLMRRQVGDLRRIVEADLSATIRQGNVRCPFHEDGTASLSVREQTFRCYGCGAKGDAFDWVAGRRNISTVDAARHLGVLPEWAGGEAAKPGACAGQPRPVPARPAEPETWRDPEWQAAVDRIVRHCEKNLWGPVGRDARRWLLDRGLDPETLGRFRVGFMPEERRTAPLKCVLDERGKPRGLIVCRGITFPWAAPGAWYGLSPNPDGAEVPQPRWLGVKVRRLGWDVDGPIPDGCEKCMQLKGSRLNSGLLYPFADLLPSQGGMPALIVEGEPDALIGGQYLGHLAPGSLPPETMQALARCPWVLIASDHDAAGARSALAWLERFPHKARRVLLPRGKDLNAFHLAGGDLVAWLRGEFRRAGIPWPIRSEPSGPILATAGGPAIERPALHELTRSLESRGMRIDGEMAFPRIGVGAVTGRITYADPAVQSWPAADRLRRIAPVVEGRAFVRADYGQIEPRILLEILRRRGLVDFEAGPDLYSTLAVAGADREAAKLAVNRLINGGSPPPGASGRLAEFVAATEAYRDVLAAEARPRGYVETLSCRAVPLADDAENHAGKAVNRVVQSTAADVFNRAAVGMAEWIAAEGMPAAVAFLLFDELWVECDPGSIPAITSMVRAEMEAAAADFGLTIPVKFDIPGTNP